MHCHCLGSVVDGVDYSTHNYTLSIAKWIGGGTMWW